MIHVYTEYQWFEFRKTIEKDKKNFQGVIVKTPFYHKEITWLLVTQEISFHRVNYGAGIFKLLPNDEKLCTNCSGKGVIK